MFRIIATCTKCKVSYDAFQSKSAKTCICEDCHNFYFDLEIIESKLCITNKEIK